MITFATISLNNSFVAATGMPSKPDSFAIIIRLLIIRTSATPRVFSAFTARTKIRFCRTRGGLEKGSVLLFLFVPM